MCDQSPGQGQTPGRAIISSLGQRDSSIYQSLCGCPRRGAIHHSIRCFPLPTRCIEGGIGGKGELQPPLSQWLVGPLPSRVCPSAWGKGCRTEHKTRAVCTPVSGRRCQFTLKGHSSASKEDVPKAYNNRHFLLQLLRFRLTAPASVLGHSGTHCFSTTSAWEPWSLHT